MFEINLTCLMHDVPKWSNALSKSSDICCKILKMCLTILGRYALKGHITYSLGINLITLTHNAPNWLNTLKNPAAFAATICRCV